MGAIDDVLMALIDGDSTPVPNQLPPRIHRIAQSRLRIELMSVTARPNGFPALDGFRATFVRLMARAVSRDARGAATPVGSPLAKSLQQIEMSMQPHEPRYIRIVGDCRKSAIEPETGGRSGAARARLPRGPRAASTPTVEVRGHIGVRRRGGR
jgi:hypothetical protein